MSSDTGWKFRSNLQNTGVYNDGGVQPDGEVLWEFNTDGQVVSCPAISNGIVYIGSDDKKVYALDADTGKKIWEFETGGKIRSSPAVSDGVVYIVSWDGNAYALDANSGEKIWESEIGYWISSSPSVSEGMVYVGSDYDKVYALNADTGQKIWEFNTGDEVASSPAISEGVVFVGSYDNKVYALDADTGKKKWEFETGGSVKSSPAVSNGVVYIGSEDKKVYALDAETGKKKWIFTAGGEVRSSPAVSNGIVYIGCGDPNGMFYALNAETGKKIWGYGEQGFYDNSPSVYNDEVYIDGSFALNADSGTKIWESSKVFADCNTVSAISNGVIYRGSQEGTVYAIGKSGSLVPNHKGETVDTTVPLTSSSRDGSIIITSIPQGASVTLDGQQKGVTPLSLTSLSQGMYTFILTSPGYQDISMTVPVVSRETGQFSLSLSPNSGAPIQPVPGKESNGEDLTVSKIALVYYKPDSNEISTDLTIKNKGTAATSKFEVTYFLSPDQTSSPFMDPDGKEVILGRDDINTLAAGQDRKASTMKTFSVSDIQLGTYWFGVYVDSQNKVPETDESNNIFYWKDRILLKVTGD